jgi:hypothetical protein
MTALYLGTRVKDTYSHLETLAQLCVLNEIERKNGISMITRVENRVAKAPGLILMRPQHSLSDGPGPRMRSCSKADRRVLKSIENQISIP